jgi:hypothetical protein
MWYNTLPPFVAMDLNMYPTYYSRIKSLDPSIVGRKKGHVDSLNQLKSISLVELTE